MHTIDYDKLAHQAVESFNKIKDFGYHGELPLGETWAFTISRHRDSDILTVSNYETIQKDMQERFPNDVETVSCNHWAVGWVDHLAVKMLTRETVGCCTEAGKAILEWQEKLSDYPVADDEDFSRRESENDLETVEACLPSIMRPYASEITSRVTEGGNHGEHIRGDDIDKEARAIAQEIEEWLHEDHDTDTEERDALLALLSCPACHNSLEPTICSRLICTVCRKESILS